MYTPVGKRAYLAVLRARVVFRRSVPLVAVATVTAGFWSLLHFNVDWIRAVYEVIAMFAVGSDLTLGHAHSHDGWWHTLWAARIVAPLLTFTAAIDVIFEMLRDRRTVPWWWRFTEHYIVVGAGRTGRLIAEQLNDDKDFPRIAVIELKFDSVNVEELRNQGIVVVIGDARESSVLERAGIRFASGVIAATPADWANVTTCFVAAKLHKCNRTFHAVAHTRKRSGAAESLTAASADGVRFHSFDAYAGVAEQIVDPSFGNFPAQQHVAVIAGLGRLGRAVLHEVVRLRSEGELNIHAIDKKPADELEVDSHTAGAALAHLTLHALPLKSQKLADSLLGSLGTLDRDAIIRAWVCTDNDEENLDFATWLDTKVLKPHSHTRNSTDELAPAPSEAQVVTRLFTWPKQAADVAGDHLPAVRPRSYGHLIQDCLHGKNGQDGWKHVWQGSAQRPSHIVLPTR